MSNHVHVILQSRSHNLSDVIRDFKKYRASQIVKAIEQNPTESRREWLLWLFKKDGSICFWTEGYHGEEIYSPSFYETKVCYIHNNPVRAGIVEKEEEYLLSSCGAMYGTRKGLLQLSEG